MNNELRAFYLNRLRSRYKTATKKQKTDFLNEAEEFTGLSRKRIIRILNQKYRKTQSSDLLRGRPSIYDELIPYLRDLNAFTGNLSAKRFKAAIPLWIDSFEKHFGQLDGLIKKRLLKVSAATIERLLRKDRRLRGISSTKVNTKMKPKIPLKKLDEVVTCPGTVQADTVAHCGTSLSGEYINTLTMVDIHTGWTENRALWTKSSLEVVRAVQSIEDSLLFTIQNFDTDCGTEFLNSNLMNYFEKRPGSVQMRRSRPYKKNDQAYVEQKNFTHVRKLFKYDRLDEKELLELMNDIYINYWGPLQNYFTPSFKLQEKQRIGAKIYKKYGKPKTPVQRLIESKGLSHYQRSQIRLKKEELDPITLKKQLNLKLKEFYDRLDQYKLRKAA